MAESIVAGIVEVVKCLAPPTERQLGYLRNYSGNFENLKAEIEKLRDETRSIERRVSEAERRGEKIEERVEKWLVSANSTIDEAAKFIEDEWTRNKRCLKALCPNLKTRYQLSKKAAVEVKALVERREEVQRFDRISYRTIPEEIWLKSNKGYEAFESRLSTLKSIQNALTDLNIRVIGLYGMGGIGKTTLVKEVARRAREDMLFDQVVFSEVSQIPDVKRIQGEIAEKLGLVLHEESESRRASRLYEQLKKEKKILIVLDNIWKSLDLETVGIPYGDDQKGSKILLTARDRNVLLGMGSEENFSIGVLNEEEAWRLFKMMAGNDAENLRLKSTAANVARACGGLPVALTTIARALRNKSVPEWKNALQELLTPSMVNFEGVPTEAYSTIELSFKYLKGAQLKKIFMLCSLIPNPVFTSYLFKCCMGLGILHGVNKMEDARNKLYALVHELKDSCLLLESDSSEKLSMHDVVQAVAISIACRDQNVFVVRNKDVWEWPDKNALNKCHAVSLIDSIIHEFPEGLECPKLEFLLMDSKDLLVEISIPEKFFTGMRKLRVVDLTRMQLFSLPSSIDLLENLQTLCLDQCILGDIAIIGKLKNLEILSFWGSDIVQLPEALGQLNKLRLLDLTNCFRLKVVAPNVLSSLIRLEELYMGNCFIEWEVERSTSERSNACFDELIHLPRLTTLEIDVKNDSILPEDFFTKKLEMFKMSIGDGSFKPPVLVMEDWFRSRPYFFISNHESLRTLKLKLNSKPICSKKMQCIKNVEYLCLDRLQGVKSVLFDLDTEGFSQLKHLHVQNNPDFLCIVDSMERVTCDAFPLLESLTLQNLIKLERICIDRLKVQSFNELKTIKVENCDELSNIFLLSTTKFLPRLERIAVINASSLEEIFTIGGEADVDDHNEIGKTEFAELKSLSLGNLPKLTSFCREVKTPSALANRQESQGDSIAISSSNEISLEDKRDTLTLLFNEKVVLPNLEFLEMNKIDVERIWHNELPARFPRFQSLTRLILWYCHKLKYVFSASMLRSFEQLQHLEINHCMGLLEIISKDRADQVTPNFVFPRVTTLMLFRLPELTCLYPAMHTSEWPALRNLVVCHCDKTKIFASELSSFHANIENNQLHIPPHQPLFLFEKIFPNLEELALSGKVITMIMQGDFPQHLFGTLKQLEVGHDDSACFPLGLLERLYNLKNLQLSYTSYKEIFSNEGYMEKNVGKFAQIKRLQLYRLNDLKHLCNQDSKLDSNFHYLETLRVHNCQNLLTLLPSSSASFQNLTEVQVFGCKELRNILTSSTAKSLVRLVSMKVFGCRAMTDVLLSDEDGAAKEEIVFSKLKTLALFDLVRLTSFCSGNCIFKFPSLQDLTVIGCPKMKNFTRGELWTPTRVSIWYGEREDERRWANDLNTTIRQLHAEKLMEGFSSYSTLYK